VLNYSSKYMDIKNFFSLRLNGGYLGSESAPKSYPFDGDGGGFISS
jgi:hypothetical protein